MLGIVLNAVSCNILPFPTQFRGGEKDTEEKFPLSSLLFALSLVTAVMVHSNRTAVDYASLLSA